MLVSVIEVRFDICESMASDFMFQFDQQDVVVYCIKRDTYFVGSQIIME